MVLQIFAEKKMIYSHMCLKGSNAQKGIRKTNKE